MQTIKIFRTYTRFNQYTQTYKRTFGTRTKKVEEKKTTIISYASIVVKRKKKTVIAVYLYCSMNISINIIQYLGREKYI